MGPLPCLAGPAAPFPRPLLVDWTGMSSSGSTSCYRAPDTGVHWVRGTIGAIKTQPLVTLA